MVMVTMGLVAEVLEEVLALVVHDHKGREVLHFDAPHGLHAQLGVLQHLHLLDAVLRETSGGTTDRAQVEAAVLLARCTRDTQRAPAISVCACGGACGAAGYGAPSVTCLLRLPLARVIKLPPFFMNMSTYESCWRR